MFDSVLRIFHEGWRPIYPTSPDLHHVDAGTAGIASQASLMRLSRKIKARHSRYLSLMFELSHCISLAFRIAIKRLLIISQMNAGATPLVLNGALIFK